MSIWAYNVSTDPKSLTHMTTNREKDMETFLPQYRHGQRTLTDKQMNLLDSLHAAGHDPIKAAVLAGYADTKSAVRSVRKELTQIAEEMLSNSSLKAASLLISVLDSDEPIFNLKEKIAVAQDLLDRSGHMKKTVIDVNHEVKGGVFILPQKEILIYEDVGGDGEGSEEIENA